MKSNLLRFATFFCLVLSAFSSQAQSTLNDGLVSYLPFEDNYVDQVSKNEATHKQTGLSFVNGKLGKGLSFDSLNAYVLTQPGLFNVGQTASSYSFFFYIPADLITPRYNFIQQLNDPTDNTQGRTIAYKNSATATTAANAIQSFVGNRATTSPVIATADKWTHVAVTIEPVTKMITIFVDGTKAITTELTATQLVEASAGAFILGHGKDTLTNGSGLRGTLDEVRIYNRLLTDAEVLALATQTVTGTKDISAGFSISVSPNPISVGHQATISVQGASLAARAGEKITVTTTDLLGRVLNTQSTNLGSLNTLLVPAFTQAGMYHVNITNGEWTMTEKLIVR